ncbi:MAG: 50S ribosomal protein L21e [Candidatus Micrarchaeota archaeon]
MSTRSLGKMSKRTRLLKKRSKEHVGISSMIKEFKKGENVSIHPKPRYDGMPHPRFRGMTGVVVSKRGNAYVLKLKVGKAEKTLIVPPVHLR